MKEKTKKSVRGKSKLFTVFLFLIVCILGNFNIVNATCSSGIKGNGTSGISININGAPYTTFAGYSYGQYAYGKEGCAWFASARVKELTGKGNTIFSGWAWYNTQYSNYGFSRGSVPRARSLACYGNHVAVVEAVNGDTITVSQGGASGLSDAAHGYCVISTMSKSKLESQGGCGTFYGYVYMDASSTSPLSISNVQISNVTSDSYTVSCNVTGNVTRVLFPTWPSADDSGNPIWHEGTISGNTASCVIRRSDHGNKTGDYISHIYIYDSAGNSISAAAPRVVMGDTQAPVISDIRVSEIKMDSFTVTCKVYDNGGVTSVKFPTWPSADDSGNPIWHDGTINGDTASCVIKKSDHGNKTGLYLTHIYAYDMNGNMTAGRAPGVIIGDTEPPVIENIKIIDVTEESYTITCTVKDNNSSGTISVRFPTWPSADDSGNPIWHEGRVNGDTASCIIKKSDHGNKTGTYISHIYAYDVVGNSSSAAAPAVELGKKHQHVYTSSIKKPATCTEPGIRLYTCKDNDDSYEEKIPATGHQHTELRNVKAATCAQEGYTGDTYCKDCNTKLSSGKSIAKKEHSWDSGKITTVATCNGKGIKTYTCTGCNATRTEEIPVTGHKNKITKFAKKASCKSEGYTGDIYCQDCGVFLEEGNVIPKSEHTWNAGEVTKPATCTGEGTKTYICTGCGTIKTEIIPSTGHESTEVRNKKEATCVKSGYTGDVYCTICNQKISSGNVVAKTGHTWNSGSITKQPTIAKEGIKTYTCRSCGLTRNETIAKLKPQKATPGKSVKDPSSNGVYKVLKDGQSVEFTKPLSKRATIKVPDTIKVNGITCKVTGIAANAFKNNTSLKNVTIGKNVTTVGTNAFYGCKNLTKVSGGNSIVKFVDRAFANCGNLGSITIPGSARSIGKQAFYNCKKLKNITIKTSTLSGKNIGSKAFTGTYKKPTVKVPAKQMKAYKKLLASKGMSSKAVYKK